MVSRTDGRLHPAWKNAWRESHSASPATLELDSNTVSQFQIEHMTGQIESLRSQLAKKDVGVKSMQSETSGIDEANFAQVALQKAAAHLHHLKDVES